MPYPTKKTHLSNTIIPKPKRPRNLIILPNHNYFDSPPFYPIKTIKTLKSLKSSIFPKLVYLLHLLHLH